MLFVIFHGSYGNPEENWFPDLREHLEGLGQDVLVPAFPVEEWDDITKKGKDTKPQKQSLNNWFETFEKYLPIIRKAKRVCFIGHSLGPLFILHIVSKYKLKLDSAIFISPFLEVPIPSKIWQIDIVNKSFYKNDFDFKILKKLIPISYVLYSDNDPYISQKQMMKFTTRLGSAPIWVKKAGHMNSAVNLNGFPLVYELCKSRLDLTLYQRYLAQRRELFAVEYLKGKTEEEIYLKPEEVLYEGIFHFRNLRKEGFATFYTGTTFWDAQSRYMQEARKAARRVKHFTRVFIVDKSSSLERPALTEQINLDLEAGIAVYLCKKEDVLSVTRNLAFGEWDLDFGVWDDDYVCFVPMDKNGRVKQVRLSSRKIDMKHAREIKKKIISKSFRIYNLEKDIFNFLNKN